MNNIYNKLAELQWQIQHRDLHMNLGDTIQIEAPDFDLVIDDVSPTTIDQELNNRSTQGITSQTPKSTEPESLVYSPCTIKSSHDPTRNGLARCNSGRDSIADRPAK